MALFSSSVRIEKRQVVSSAGVRSNELDPRINPTSAIGHESPGTVDTRPPTPIKAINAICSGVAIKGPMGAVDRAEG